jgi:hypothetical protein
MWTALIGGVLIGISTDWLGRFVLPIFVAIISLFELLFLQLRGSLKSRHLTKMKESGMSDSEIKEMKDTIHDLDSKTINLGMSKFKLYGIQFLWTYSMTLAVSLISGLLKQLFF